MLIRKMTAGIGMITLCVGTSFSQSRVDNYPSKPVNIIVPSEPGTTSEVSAREIAQILNQTLGKPFLVDFKPGAGGKIGLSYVAKSAPDGYTLASISSSFTTLPALDENLPFDPLKSFTPVTLFTKRSVLLVVTPSFPAKNFAEYLAYAKANPGKINMGDNGIGSSFHLFGELLAYATGTKVTFIHYKGNAQNFIDLVAGRVHASPMTVFASLPFVKGGKVRPIAQMTRHRSPFMPDLPTVEELGISGVDVSIWVGMAAPAGVPADILAKLNRPLVAYGKSPENIAKAAAQGDELVGSTPEVLGKLIASELASWKEVVKAGNIKIE